MPRRRLALAELQPERVCLIKPSSLGDVVNAVPTFLALRARWPNARFTWVVNRGLSSLVEGLPGLDEVVRFDRSKAKLTREGLGAMGSLVSELRQRRFDLALDLQGLLRSGLMSFATGAPVRVGLSDAREGATWFYTHRVPMPKEPTHAVDRLMLVARAFGAEDQEPRFTAAMSENDRRWARLTLAEVPAPRLVLNLGARWVTKQWPPDRFAEIALQAVKEFGAGLIAVGAPEDQPLVEELRSHLDGVRLLDLCGRTTLPQLAALAAESDVFLSNDTGPLHLAAAAGARVVGIYLCTSPKENGPYGERAAAVETTIWCAGSYLKSCPHMLCKVQLMPDRVWSVVSRQLQAAGWVRSPAA